MLVTASLIVLKKAIRVDTFKFVKQQICGILLIGCFFILFGLLYAINGLVLSTMTGLVILTVLAVIW